MKLSKPQPVTPDETEHRASAFGEWMLSNARREIRAGRLRQTIGDDGEHVPQH